MAMEMKVEIVARETIKPSSPTPSHLRNFKLSLLDQLGPAAYGPLVLFYSFGSDPHHRHVTTADRSRKLKESLSETLTLFYPFAGRIEDNICIDCNDHGVGYVEARVDCLLSNFLDQPSAEEAKRFLPIEIESGEASTGPLLLVQVSFFRCGGMAIGSCLSHKIADAASVSMFLKSWAATALGCRGAVLPLFNAASVFPPGSFSAKQPPPAIGFNVLKCVAKRFVFPAQKISALQAKAASAEVQQPRRVEAVKALIWRCAMKASKSTSGSSRPSLMFTAANIRRKVSPPLPENSIGNLISYYNARTEKNQIEIQAVVAQLRKAFQQFIKNHAERLGGKDSNKLISEYFKEAVLLPNENFDIYISSSLCSFGFYEVDFGWGKPSWVTIPPAEHKNAVLLIDTKEPDGIEAWVILSEEDMALFEHDQELLAFASPNPRVLTMSSIVSSRRPFMAKSSL